MLDYRQDHSELDYQFKKDIKSNTKVKAWHVKIGKDNYQIQSTPLPRLYTIVLAYKATRTGKIIDSTEHLLCIRTEDLNEGAEELIAVMKGEPTRKMHEFPKNVF